VKFISTAVLSVLGFSAPSFAAQYHAVPALTGNANMGVNCINAPQSIDNAGIASQCQQLTVPTNPRIAAQFPVPPKHYNVQFNNPDSPVFREFDGYPMVIERSAGKCFLRNELVNTIEPQRNVSASEFTSFSYDCATGPEESFDTSRLLYQYTVSGAFQPQNDAHLFASVTMQMAAHYFADLYPQQTELCPAWGGDYCLEQLQQRVGYSAEGQKYSSDWDGKFVNLAEGGSVVSQFSHASSLDIVAHEIGHALLTWNSPLLYQGEEPAAVQEAFSDMTALAARDYYIRHLDGSVERSFLDSPMAQAWQNSAEKKWWLGTGFKFNGSPLRFIAQPRFDLISIDDARDIADANGPHQKAGALNKFFYLLADSAQWNIEKAYKLALKAAKNCFKSDTDIAAAGLCFESQAPYADRALIRSLLKQVGIVSEHASGTHLAFELERQLDELTFSITDKRFSNSQARQFEILVDGESFFAWQKNNGQGSFANAKHGRVSLPLGANLIELAVKLSDGRTLSAARHIFSAEQARCQPKLTGTAATNLQVNSEQLYVDKAFAHLDLVTDLYHQDKLTLRFNTPLNNRFVSVFADLDRDRVFEADNNSNELIYTQADSTDEVTFNLLGTEQINAGPLLLRVRIDDAQQSACDTANNAQVIDLKVNLKKGSNLQSVDFATQQINDQITLTAQATGQGNHTYKWYFNGQLDSSTSQVITRSINSDTLVKVESLLAGKVVATEQRMVKPVAPINLAINCVVEGTQCRFNVDHASLPSGVSGRYFWDFGDNLNTSDTRTNAESFLFDYKASGQYSAKLTVYLDSLNAQFTVQTSVNISVARPEVTFTTQADSQNSLQIFFSAQHIDTYKQVFWSVEQTRYEQTDFTKPWSHTFTSAGTHAVLLTVVYPDETRKTIRKEITVEAEVGETQLQILSIDTDLKSWDWWWCDSTEARNVAQATEVKAACKYAEIDTLKVNTNFDDNSLLKYDYWVDFNKDGVFSQDEKNTNHTITLGSNRIPVCVTAYTLEHAETSSACIAPEGGATFNFYITK
jgi:Zn-dependent metalloprotease